MKAIISHDVDHITVWEHMFRDLIIPKYMARMHIELLAGKITMHEYVLRWADLFKNKWQNVDELITFNNVSGVPSSFFIAVSKGVGLSYTNELSAVWIEQMKARQCEIGLHGIAFQNKSDMLREKAQFEALTGLTQTGIRMHYIRSNERTYDVLSEAGYRYDSTQRGMINPFRIGNMWEFPIQIMDGWIIENYKSWQSIDLKTAKENTRAIIDQARQSGLEYISIDFHDRYFSNAFKTWLDWYMWLVEYLKAEKISFVNFNSAVEELERRERVAS